MSHDQIVCCKKCGSTKVRAESGTWGPHDFRIECKEPNCRAVTWGRPPQKDLYAEIGAAQLKVILAMRWYLQASGWKRSAMNDGEELWEKTVDGFSLVIPTAAALYIQRVTIEGKPL